MDSVNKKRTKKRRRTVISPDEIEKLEESFGKEQKPDRITKLELAKQLSKSENFVNIWFQNRRAKERKLNKPNEQGMYPASETDVGLSRNETTGKGDMVRKLQFYRRNRIYLAKFCSFHNS